MPFQPPTRPHSANPHIILNSSIFPRPSSAASNRTKSSIPSPTKRHLHRGSHEWEDAWDSGSDNEDHDQPRPDLRNGAAPIPINGNGNGHQRESSTGSVVAASWASGSYQHISHRPMLNTSKTYTEGAIPPPLGTASPSGTGQGESSGSRLPPGGAWELVDPVVEEEEDLAPPPKAGKEAIRQDANEILRGRMRARTQR
jgi:hypothetical protein